MKFLVNLFLVLYLEHIMAQAPTRQSAQPASYSHTYFTSGSDPKVTKTTTKVYHPISSSSSSSLKSLYENGDQHQLPLQQKQLQQQAQNHYYHPKHQQQQQQQHQLRPEQMQELQQPKKQLKQLKQSKQPQHQRNHEDMQPEESTRLQVKPKHATKPSFKQFYESDEDLSEEHYKSIEDYSDEFPHSYHYKDNGNHGYIIGEQIRVQHPDKPSGSRKFLTDKTIKGKFNHFGAYDDYSHELHDMDISYALPPIKKHKYDEAIRVIAPSKAQQHQRQHQHQTKPLHFTAITAHDNTYSAFEPDTEYIAGDDLKESLRQQFRKVASKKQIEKYLEDQEKFLDEALEWQMLHNPKYKKLTRLLETELPSYEKVPHVGKYYQDFEPRMRSHFLENYPKQSIKGTHMNRPRRRPLSGSGFGKVDMFKHVAAKPKITPMLTNKTNRKYRQTIVF